MSNFDLIKQQILNCRDCQIKFGFEPRPFFWGSDNAKIFQISQAPSLKAHKQQKPFADTSGKRLLQWFNIDENTFYNPKNFYITALSHCYPGKNKNGYDKMPSSYCANKWLYKEIQVVKNQIYIIIGAKAAKFFFPEKDFEYLVFTNQTLNNKLAIILPHPSPLNFRWIKQHPHFLDKRLPQIQQILHSIL